MNLKDYTKFTDTVAIYPKDNKLNSLMYVALGIGGEAGECLDCIKKIARSPDDKELEKEQIQKLLYELGDLAYYWTRMCVELGYDPEDILHLNYVKLSERKKNDTLARRKG